MFTGFTDETVQFLMDLKFHNTAEFFHNNHDLYVEVVQRPFYELIGDLAPEMQKIDPLMETRPHKCLSRIHRDTRFSRDKSPYRDHHWLLFRHMAEPREKSLFYYFEFGPDRLSWGLGIWGENRELMDLYRRRMRADPGKFLSLISGMNLPRHHLLLGGTSYRRMEVPPEIPETLRGWYMMKEMYIGKHRPSYRMAFSEQLGRQVLRDFRTLAPMYQMLRGCVDAIQSENDGKDR